jgi:hypothetical protein
MMIRMMMMMMINDVYCINESDYDVTNDDKDSLIITKIISLIKMAMMIILIISQTKIILL